MAHFNYIKLESVIARVYELFPPERINEKTLYKWASDAIKEVFTSESMQDGVCFSEVINHKAKLPQGYKQVYQILYKENIECPFTIATTVSGTAIALQATSLIDESIATPAGATAAPLGLLDSRQPLLNQPAGYVYPSNMLFMSSCSERMRTCGWGLLPKSTSLFHKSINHGIDISGECCKQTYSFDKGCNTITTSFEKGWVAISFRGYPECDGSYMIPDYESSVPVAIEKYLLYKIFEKETIMGIEGSGGQEQKYHKEWELMCAKAKGNQKLMNIDDLENLRKRLVRLGQHNNSYNSGFGNAADFENFMF